MRRFLQKRTKTVRKETKKLSGSTFKEKKLEHQEKYYTRFELQRFFDLTYYPRSICNDTTELVNLEFRNVLQVLG